MPYYQFEHVVPLSDAQKDELAEFVTHAHTEIFSAPRLFVNVRFDDMSQHVTYVAGKRRSTNRLIAHVRHGPSRTQELYSKLCTAIEENWRQVVKHDIHAIFVMGSIVAGWEAGFTVPRAGEDHQWMKDNAAEFVKMADAGNTDMQGLVHEIKTTPAFSGIL